MRQRAVDCAVDVECSVFGFSYRAVYCRDTTADAVQSAVDGVVVGVAEVMPSGGDGDGAWARMIRGIRVSFENHVTAGVAGSIVGMQREVVEEMPGGGDSSSSGVRLSGRNVITGG